jgi:hypothetical protein
MNQALMSLMLAIPQNVMRRRIHLGIDRVEVSTGSADVLLTYAELEPAALQELASRLGIDFDVLVTRLDEEESQERLSEPNPADPDRARVMTAVVATAYKATHDELREPQANPDTARSLFVAHLLELEGDARRVVLELQTRGDLAAALSKLRQTESAPVDLKASLFAGTRELLDASWGQIQKEMREKEAAHFSRMDQFREEHYAKNPAYYEEPVDLPAAWEKSDELMHRMGACLRAARNEARIRRAPEVRLDHMIIALLQPGTNTAKYLTSRGIDWGAWRIWLDDRLPRQEDGPRFPENARDLGMNLETNRTLVPKEGLPIPDSDLTREDVRKHMGFQETGQAFTDLHFLLAASNEPKSLTYQLLARAGLTTDDLQGEVETRASGATNWREVEPNLAASLKKPPALLRGLSVANAFETAGQFYARRRGAAQVTVDDLIRATLQPETDTSALLAELGIDRLAIINAIEEASPPGSARVNFPNMDEAAESLRIGLLTMRDSESSDLRMIEAALIRRQSESAGRDALEAAGLTLDKVQDRLEELGVELSFISERGKKKE